MNRIIAMVAVLICIASVASAAPRHHRMRHRSHHRMHHARVHHHGHAHHHRAHR